jgi:hypothetical protein
MAIFLSYSRHDEVVVKALAKGIEAGRREVWFDHNLGGGDVWWDRILENIRLASAFLFAVSDTSLQSKACRLELGYAFDLRRPVVPIQVGPISSFRANNPLAQLQIIPYVPDRAESGFAILAALDEAVARVGPLPEVLPEPPPIPYGYLLTLGQEINSTELTSRDQGRVVDQLRRALGEETEESVRRDIRLLLTNLAGKPWVTKAIEREIARVLNDHPVGSTPEPKPAGQGEADPREWFVGRLERLQQQRQAAAAGRQGPGNRPSPARPADWRDTFGPQAPGRPGPAGPQAPAPQAPGPTAPQAPGPTGLPAPGPTGPRQDPIASGAAAVPRSYWPVSVVALLFCPPLGGIALHFSAEVGKRHAAGDGAGAVGASARALWFGIAGIATTVAILLITFVR